MAYYKNVFDDEELRIVMMGKTGAGKSSLGNTLLGTNVFEVEAGMSSGTEEAKVGKAVRFNTLIKVTDTPGLSDTNRRESEIHHEVQKSLSMVWPGPHVILFVVRSDSRFTKEEYRAFIALKKLFGQRICSHVIAIFTGIDGLQHGSVEKQMLALREEIRHCDPDLKEVMGDVGFRFCGVTNKVSRSTRDRQACHIIQTVQELVEVNGGRYFPSVVARSAPFRQHRR